MAGPNPLVAAWSMLRSRRVRPPDPSGDTTHEPGGLNRILTAVAGEGIAALDDLGTDLDRELARLSRVSPPDMHPDHALAYWIDLYNTAALSLARRARAEQANSVLELHRAFTDPVVQVDGEALSLDAIEHGKIRRFGDPRIHAALVCGSVSCPTLRHEAYDGDRIEDQLDDQMRWFLASGAARRSGDHTIELSRVFLWYGADFVRPDRMPTILPARRTKIVDAIAGWLPDTEAAWVRRARPRVAFQDYDWALGCSVSPPAGSP